MRESIPYGRQEVDDEDIAAVVEVLRGDWLTTGPAVEHFESVFAELVGAQHAVAVNNGTAALHLASVFHRVQTAALTSIRCHHLQAAKQSPSHVDGDNDT